MREYKFYQVDVFAESRFGGNPLAVFPDAAGLSDAEMHAIAFELAVPETSFVLAPESGDAQFKIRIFTQFRELSFAGHPTIGTHYVLANLNRIPLTDNPTRVYQELKAGIFPVDIYLENGRVGKITMTQKEPRLLDYIDDLDELAQGLCCEIDDLDLDFASPRVVSTGMPCMMVPVKSTNVLGQLGIDVRSLRAVCDGHGCEMAYAFTVRNTLREGSTAQARFFSGHLLYEDAATGSAAGALGAFLVAKGYAEEQGLSRLVIDQGDYMGRPSRIYVTVEQDQDQIRRVEVSGRCRHVFEATLRLDD